MFSANLVAAGSERAVVVLAEALQHRGHEVSIVLWNNPGETFYEIPAGVKRVDAALTVEEGSVRWFDLAGNARRLSRIRKAIRQTRPDVVISFLDGTNELFILASLGESYRKILSCQIDISQHQHYNPRWEKLRGITYRWADRVVFLDKDQARAARSSHPKWVCDGIPNPLAPIDTEPGGREIAVMQEAKKFRHTLVAMGRMSEQKGFDILLDVFKSVRDQMPGTGLVIIGDGELRDQLEQQRERLGLEECVLMPGLLKKPHAIIASADLFVFSSRYEGQGLALMEAMACGVAVVSFACPSGPGRIIRDGVDGVLVPPEDGPAMRDAIVRLLGSDELRLEIARAAKTVAERYSTDPIVNEWERILTEPGG